MSQSDRLHFGWLKPSGRAEGHFEVKIEGARLTIEQSAECDRAASFFGRIRPFFLDYLVADDYYGDALRVPGRIAVMLEHDPFLIQKVGLFHLKSHLICDKAVNGFVSAGAIFRDRLLSRLGIDKESNHPILHRLQDIYDRSFEYRLFYGLRNFSQHGDAIIDVIPMSTNPKADTPTSARLVIRRDRLRKKMKRVSATLRSDLDSAPDEIDFVNSAKIYMECLRELFAAFLALDVDELRYALDFIHVVRSGARGLPEGATPILLKTIPDALEKGEVTAGTVFDVSAMFLPMDEAALLERLFPQLSRSHE